MANKLFFKILRNKSLKFLLFFNQNQINIIKYYKKQIIKKENLKTI